MRIGLAFIGIDAFVSVSRVSGIACACVGSVRIFTSGVGIARIVETFVDVNAFVVGLFVPVEAFTFVRANGIFTERVHRTVVGVDLAFVYINALATIALVTRFALAVVATVSVETGGIVVTRIHTRTFVDICTCHAISFEAVFTFTFEGAGQVTACGVRRAVVGTFFTFVHVCAIKPVARIPSVAYTFVPTHCIFTMCFFGAVIVC
jgi:hypothetical protein